MPGHKENFTRKKGTKKKIVAEFSTEIYEAR